MGLIRAFLSIVLAAGLLSSCHASQVAASKKSPAGAEKQKPLPVPAGEAPQFDEPPVLIYFERPEYPSDAREGGFEGDVRVKLLVDEKGLVRSVEIIDSDVTRAMEKTAVNAAWKCLFRPATREGVPVRCHVMIPYYFRLRG